MNWRINVKYPNAEGHGSRKGVVLMDCLDSLIPFADYAELDTDRIGKYSRWIAAGEKAGLLTYSDASDIRQELIHGCGGL